MRVNKGTKTGTFTPWIGHYLCVCVCVSHFTCVPSISLLILCYFVMVYPCFSDKVKPTQWVGYSANKPGSNGPKSRSQNVPNSPVREFLMLNQHVATCQFPAGKSSTCRVL